MEQAADVRRRLPVGAEVVAGVGTHFRVWAPDHPAATLVMEGEAPGGPRRELTMVAEEDGYFAVLAPGVGAGTRYWFRLGAGDALYPDLASRYQPEGPFGPSEVVDPRRFEWTDAKWRGVGIEGQVLYEMHIGTFTKEGTWAAAARELRELREAGITVLEVMPVADFPGRFGWGYDGVDLYAPTQLYGTPEDFRRFVDEAHRLGLAVILDVVYNHVGPAGAFFTAYTKSFFSDRYENEWGEPINFDGPRRGPVRDFFVGNAAYWIDEYHLDGLRLDATQQMFDSSPEHIIASISKAARAAAGKRRIVMIGENESQVCRLAQPVEEGGYGLDALWNDDYHHTALVAMCGRTEAYYTDYLGSAQEFVSAMKYGYLYQGQRYAWQKKARGTPTWELGPAAMVNFLENHDQLANSPCGCRTHTVTSPGRYRALLSLTLLGPGTPMLFQGQEFGSTSPFLYFADHDPELAEAVRKGRFEFLSQFPSMASPEMQSQLDDPSSPTTFERCRLDFSERQTNHATYDLTKDLLRLRREDPVLRLQAPRGVDGAVLSPQAFVLRFFSPEGHEHDRLLLVNLGRDLPLRVAPEPLLAPPSQMSWKTAWSSDDPRYGGQGTPPVVGEEGIRLPGEAAVLLIGEPRSA